MLMISTWSMFSFPNSSSSIMEHLSLFHDYTMMIMIFIISFIFFSMMNMLNMKFINRFFTNNQLIEIIWTIIPIFILLTLAIPSLKTLYLTEEVNSPLLTFKAIGHQWFWEYQMNDLSDISIQSYMINKINNLNLFRLLDVDNRLITPLNSQIRLLTTSDDVIHSFTIPSLGMKMDSIPGRINQIYLYMKRPGIYYGQCSEICGINHSFMPIVMEVTSLNKCLNYYLN